MALTIALQVVFSNLISMLLCMGTFLYFAYGSNMLTERLTAIQRCPSAMPRGIAVARGYSLAFTKPSRDLSGKATLTETDGCHQYGVLFEIDDRELSDLDREEGRGNGYERDDLFPVVLPDGSKINVSTYIASECKSGLNPYDWYLALIVAGAKQHNLPVEQIEALQATVFDDVNRNQRAINGRRNAVTALNLAGFDNIASILGKEQS